MLTLPHEKLNSSLTLDLSTGYRSRARSALKGRIDEPLFSGNSAFRALIPCSLLQDDDLFPLINWKDQSCYAWYYITSDIDVTY